MSRVIDQIEKGKQIGKVFSLQKNGLTYWSSVGIQKHEGVYKVYIDMIEESKMSAEEYAREEFSRFMTANEALNYAVAESGLSEEEFTPCKGQKIFNPAFG